MCRYVLETCPYPDQDPVTALIFEPTKLKLWEICELPTAWGRLSCGNLVIQHSLSPAEQIVSTPVKAILTTHSNLPSESDSCLKTNLAHVPHPSTDSAYVATNIQMKQPQETAACVWCSAVMKYAATKSNEVRALAQKSLDEIERVMDTSEELRAIQRDIHIKTQELNSLRHVAWALSREQWEDKLVKDTQEEKDNSDS
ncbi:hypothetical protein PV10_00272 [Exophiala mesophila]|uniref:Uncharacterized protein n=1 Tax=Exophiala mesophila TaxID=212818 RepID=A0A0D1ZQZ9_EXOME|nr:uncharacterized protein PV10_00272 [Exophiala mesophila]KIV96394.1 hypothetical protein PV10_00272 [Exophiala mesophila]